MSSSMRLSFRSVETYREMSSAEQQNSDVVREKTPFPLIEKLQGKHRVRHSFSQLYIDRGFESTESASAKKAHSRSSGNERKPQLGGRAHDDNELVKHMSNLPGFLQQVEKDKTVQGKALNFGVLDWKRLEKWKYTERMPGKISQKASSGSDSFVPPSGLPKMRPNLRKQPSSHARNHSLLYSGKQTAANDAHFRSPQHQQPSHKLYLRSSKEGRNHSYMKEEEYAACRNSKGKETCIQKKYIIESIDSGRQQNHFQQNAYKSKRSPQKEMMSGREASSSSKQGKHNIAFLSPNEVSPQGKKNMMRYDDVKLTSECSPAEAQNIVLLAPKYVKEKSCSENSQFRQFKTSVDEQLPAALNRLSDYSVDIPHSCPLPSNARDADSITSISSEPKSSDVSKETIKPSISGEVSTRKQAGVGEHPTLRGRSPSPTSRFSFKKMTRSFSFKESSAPPQVSSTYTTVKSGPVKPEVATSVDSLEKDQTNSSTRARSSPLRRLLDPLLKHKSSGETIRSSNGSLRTMTISPIKGLPQDIKAVASTFEALLQLTFKNGLPFFRLVVENSKDILAAAVKRLPTSEKIDPCMIYSFYSVHEIMKKSTNWIGHGSKSKSLGLGYNIIGQMKISTGECDARECVLYGVNPGQVDKQSVAFESYKEIAAIVVKHPGGKKFPEERENPNAVLVILPGAVHGIPIKGSPSSLISRWRSGGSCDCGGWDIGCKLQILSSSRKSSNDIQESISSSFDCINLFMEGAERKGRPVFSLKPLSDEFFSIELDSSISLLEAFATSVAYISSRKIPEIIDSKGGANPRTDERKTQMFQEQIPARFVTCPPLSPVGRI